MLGPRLKLRLEFMGVNISCDWFDGEVVPLYREKGQDRGRLPHRAAVA